MKNKRPTIKPQRNFVAKHAETYCKAKVFRDRKKEYTKYQKHEDHELEHPVHRPYSRYELDKDYQNDEEQYYEEWWDEDEEELELDEPEALDQATATGMEQPGPELEVDEELEGFGDESGSTEGITRDNAGCTKQVPKDQSLSNHVAVDSAGEAGHG